MSDDHELSPLSAKEQEQLNKTARSTGPDGGNKKAALSGIADMERHLGKKDPKNKDATELAKLLSANDSFNDPGSN